MMWLPSDEWPVPVPPEGLPQGLADPASTQDGRPFGRAA
jgi:hypothetical protein